MIWKEVVPQIWKNKEQIAEGIKNNLFKKKDIEELFDARMSICKGCIWNSENIKGKQYKDLPLCIQHIKSEEYIKDSQERSELHCVHCSCYLKYKLRVPKAHCPIGQWPAVASEDESFLIQELTE